MRGCQFKPLALLRQFSAQNLANSASILSDHTQGVSPLIVRKDESFVCPTCPMCHRKIALGLQVDR